MPFGRLYDMATILEAAIPLEATIVFEVEGEAVGHLVMPGHDVGDEGAAGKGRSGCRFAGHDGMITSFKLAAATAAECK